MAFDKAGGMSASDYRRETDEIKAQLLMRIGDVARALLPDGRKEGGLWVSHNPAGDDMRKAPALKVRVSGGDAGAWYDWRSGDKGDVFGLIEHCKRCDFKDARRWAMDFLGIRAMSRAERAKLSHEAVRYQERESAKAEGERLARLAKAMKLWNAADTKASAWREHALAYFAARAMPLKAIPHLNPDTFRFARATEYWKGAKWQGGGRAPVKLEDGPQFPAIHSAMRNRLGLLTACHVTFLDPDAPKKAPVQPAKLMLGQALGAVIEISMGPEGKPFWLAQQPHPLIIGEGIETCGPLAIAVPEARVWAGGSLAGISGAPIDLPCIAAVFFARDNNDGNDQAQKQFQSAFDALAAHGKPLAVMASHVGDDFNDLARGEV
jgi:Toprim domain